MSNFLPFFDSGGGAPSAPLPLDMVPGAAFAYSTRKLRAAATSSVQIRRASDGANTALGFAGVGFDAAGADAFLAATTGTLMALADQSGAGGTALQLTAANQPAFDKIGGAYGGRWAATGPQVLSAPGAPAIDGLFAAGGYVLAVVELATVNVGNAAGLLTKGSWSVFLYRAAAGDSAPAIWMIQSGAGAQGAWGTGMLPAGTGRHLIEIEYNSASPANVPTFRLDSAGAALVSSSGYSGAALADTGPLEVGNSSLLSSGAAGFAGRILEVIGYKPAPSAGNKASLRDSAKAFWGTP